MTARQARTMATEALQELADTLLGNAWGSMLLTAQLAIIDSELDKREG